MLTIKGSWYVKGQHLKKSDDLLKSLKDIDLLMCVKVSKTENESTTPMTHCETKESTVINTILVSKFFKIC